jgi:Phosphotransferase enzyme family
VSLTVGFLDPDAVRWVERSLGGGWIVTAARRLGGPTGPRLIEVHQGVKTDAVVLRDGDATQSSDRFRFEAETAGLRAAAELGIDAPRVINHDPDGTDAGRLAILSTCLVGENTIPRIVTADRLRALGRAAASLCRTPRNGAGLATRPRPLGDIDVAGERAARSTTLLLERADELLRARPPSVTENVLVHGAGSRAGWALVGLERSGAHERDRGAVALVMFGRCEWSCLVVWLEDCLADGSRRCHGAL